MSKIEQKYRDIVRNNKDIDVKPQIFVKEMDEKLKRMGIERRRSGPRISDPAHSRGKSICRPPMVRARIYDFTLSTATFFPKTLRLY